MDIQTHTINKIKIAEIRAEGIVINQLEDALDLIGNLYYEGFDKVILYEKNITQSFFDLKTKLAGDILQKFTQYQMQLVIIGEFSKYQSKSLNDFIYESNKGKQINFAQHLEQILG